MGKRYSNKDAHKCFMDLMAAMGNEGKITDIRTRKKGGYYLDANVIGYRVMKVITDSGAVHPMFGSGSARDFCEKVEFSKEVLDEKNRPIEVR